MKELGTSLGLYPRRVILRMKCKRQSWRFWNTRVAREAQGEPFGFMVSQHVDKIKRRLR